MTSQSKSEKDYRRIQITGGSTYILSIPRNWVEKKGLGKGSLVHIVQNEDSSLSIKSEELFQSVKNRKAIIIVSLSDTPESVVRRLISTYITGFNIIQIKARDNRIDTDVKVSVKEIVRKKFIGTEILSDSPREIAFQVLLGISELPINDALKRMAAMTASMHRDAVQALRLDDGQLAKDVIDADDEVDRFNLYIIRLLKLATSNPQLLNKIGIQNPSVCLSYRLITRAVERTADHAVNIARNQFSIKNLGRHLLDELAHSSESALKIFESAVEAVFTKSYDKAENLILLAEETRKTIDRVTILVNNSESATDCSQLRLIMESVIRTLEYSRDIAETVLNMTIGDVIAEV